MVSVRREERERDERNLRARERERREKEDAIDCYNAIMTGGEEEQAPHDYEINFADLILGEELGKVIMRREGERKRERERGEQEEDCPLSAFV